MSSAAKISSGNHKLRLCISETYIVRPNRDHEFGIGDSPCHDTADRELSFDTWLGRISGKDDDLLDRFIPKNSVDLVPEVVASAQPLPVVEIPSIPVGR
jgi:hypothetical protein